MSVDHPVEGRTALDVSLAVLRDVLKLPSLDPHTELMALAQFNSIVIADVVERLENEFGVTLDDELIMPDTFRTPLTVAALLVRPAMSEDNA